MANAVELATAYISLTPSMAGASGVIGKELGGSQVQGAVGKAGDKAGKTFAGKFSSAGKLAAKGIGLGLLGAAAASGAWAASTVKDLANVQRIGALTEATIKATGGAAGRSRADIDGLAGSIEKMSGIEAETVTEGQNMLLTFKNIKGQRFDEATTAMTDMAVAMNKGSLEGLDLKASSIQLGKALNDPIKGVTALAKVGVGFTEQQKAQIKTMVEAGDVAGAQGVILDEMKAQFGGAAEAAGGTFQGNIEKLKNGFGNLSEGLLSGALPVLNRFVSFLLKEGVPALERMGTWMKVNVLPVLRQFGGFIAGTVVPALGNMARWIGRNKDFIIPLVAALGTMAGIIGTVVAAMRVWAAVQLVLNAVMSANPIGIIIVAIAGLVAGLVWFFTKTEVGRKIVAAAWAGIKTAMSAVSDWWTKTAWPAIRAAITSMGRFFVGLKDGVVAVWNGIRSAISAVWQWIDKNVFAKIRFGIAAVRLGFYLAGVGIGIIWSTIRSNLSAGWNWVNKNVFSPFKRGLGLIGDAFKAVPGVVEKAWNKIREAAAKPINFVINTVYMQGIKKTWDKIADAVGLDLKLPTIKPIAFAQGSEDHRAQIARGGEMRLWAEPETGGEAYIPLASSKRGRSTAILSAVAGKFGYGLEKYADGGISGWFGDAWDKIKDVSGSFLSGPAELIKKLITGPMNSALGGIGGSSLGKIASALPKKLVSGLVEKAKDFASSMFGGGSGGGRFAGKGMGWQNMWNVVKNQFPGANLNSAYRPGAITAVGTPSFHGKGRAIDVSPSMAIFNWLAKSFPNSSELIFSPAGRRQLYMGRQTQFGEPTRGNHWDHVHWAMANGGIFSGLFDQGGWLPDGGVGINRSGRPEAVLDPDESRALKAGLNRQAPLVGTLVVRDEWSAVREMEAMQHRSLTRSGLGRVRG